jgi:predicted esterase
LKTLHTTRHEIWQFNSFAELKGIVRRVENPSEVILLLHGLGERGKRIYRKLIKNLPENALIIAPNGPFPIRRNKTPKMDFGHSWYFYDKNERKYFITQDLSKYWLRDLLAIENPHRLPVTIIGFSQGGYLAPVAGGVIPETKLVIGLACEFRSSLIHAPPLFPLVQVHGVNDDVVYLSSAGAEKEKLHLSGIEIEFHQVEDTAHEISLEMALRVKTILEAYAKRSL